MNFPSTKPEVEKPKTLSQRRLKAQADGDVALVKLGRIIEGLTIVHGPEHRIVLGLSEVRQALWTLLDPARRG